MVAKIVINLICCKFYGKKNAPLQAHAEGRCDVK